MNILSHPTSSGYYYYNTTRILAVCTWIALDDIHTRIDHGLGEGGVGG